MSDGESSEATKPPETPLETSIEALLKRLATGGITPELANKHLKLKIAETARLMADNQKILDDDRKRRAADRAYEERQAEAIAKRQLGGNYKEPPESSPDAGSEDVQINIDSPTITTYPQAPAPAPAQASAPEPPAPTKKTLSTKAVIAGAIGTALLGTGIGWGIARLAAPVASGIVDTDTTLEVEAVQLYQPPGDD